LVHLSASRKPSRPPPNMTLRSLLLSTLAAQASAVWLAGVNIAGCEIGMDTSVSGDNLSKNWAAFE
jgi:hypothetical protein